MLRIVVNSGSGEIKLPESVVEKFKGKTVEIVETAEGVLMRAVPDDLLAARGILKGTGFGTEEFLALKAEEKTLER